VSTKRNKCFFYTSEKDLAVAVAEGRVSEHDALVMRQFSEFLRDVAVAPPPLHRKPPMEDS
jgi:hypothetical protein